MITDFIWKLISERNPFQLTINVNQEFTFFTDCFSNLKLCRPV